jgi:hypothetical protein
VNGLTGPGLAAREQLGLQGGKLGVEVAAVTVPMVTWTTWKRPCGPATLASNLARRVSVVRFIGLGPPRACEPAGQFGRLNRLHVHVDELAEFGRFTRLRSPAATADRRAPVAFVRSAMALIGGRSNRMGRSRRTGTIGPSTTAAPRCRRSGRGRSPCE